MPENKEGKRVWLTEWMRDRTHNKPSSASITLNEIPIGIEVRENVQTGRLQVSIHSMPVEDLALIRKALNDFWALNGMVD